MERRFQLEAEKAGWEAVTASYTHNYDAQIEGWRKEQAYQTAKLQTDFEAEFKELEAQKVWLEEQNKTRKNKLRSKVELAIKHREAQKAERTKAAEEKLQKMDCDLEALKALAPKKSAIAQNSVSRGHGNSPSEKENVQASREDDGMHDHSNASTPTGRPSKKARLERATAPHTSFADPITSAQKTSLMEKTKQLQKRQGSKGFVKPVDPIRLNLPTYFDVVKDPMDLGTMSAKLKDDKYSTVQEYVDDFNLIVSNAKRFNGTANAVTDAASLMEQYFKKMMEGVPGAKQSCFKRKMVEAPNVKPSEVLLEV